MADRNKDKNKVTLRVMMNKERNKVMYAEAGKDFVDALFSFLTLPLGTIARLVAEESNIEAVRFGSISSIYQSVTNLDEQCLWTKTCKEMLLKPRNSMEAYCQKMKLNIHDTEPMQHFICGKWECVRKETGNRLSLFKNQKCSCGNVMDKVLSLPPECLILGSGFVKGNTSFVISDDLYVMPNVFGTVVRLLQKQEITDIRAIVEQTVDISKKEVVDILKLSLVSKTPLTDFIFKEKYSELVIGLKDPMCKIGNLPSGLCRQISVKVVRRKSTGEILFAEASDDFINFIFSFLTFPLGGVLHMLQGFSSLNCIDNLYKSMTELSPENYLISHLKNKLTKPSVAAQFGLYNQIIPIETASLPVYYRRSHLYTRELTTVATPGDGFCGYDEKRVLLNFVDPKFSASKSSNCGEFVKGPPTYMLTDALVVTPMSSFNAISHLNSLNVSLYDLDEKVVTIGQKEGLCILKAWLNSTSSSAALTNGLYQFLTNIKEEK